MEAEALGVKRKRKRLKNNRFHIPGFHKALKNVTRRKPFSLEEQDKLLNNHCFAGHIGTLNFINSYLTFVGSPLLEIDVL